ncbi:Cytochrome c oxidase assembly protein COX16, mitochondrial [Neolecta irregularis DAH-3]|uniref:Cytochrome c oxidase assembly protein COX16, mitochondrial n=1 Tax=Neolecta irregularis (strain DAH-3) TaxID=1198029 RepID=A0A1U7LTW3_NEOID|nr:Cytochrome c oxidase assembly protein COX16, mitochondrial [Neolecta irregularis DAH-3]|eukprot:OLL26110.1 Cytochrome c oxidase assembly protein COX16, mitochondrial [Neolecta irregularis DAH-3]
MQRRTWRLPSSFYERARKMFNRHPFMLFGMPFMATMVAGSFALENATTLKYERHDRKVKEVTEEEALSIARNRRKFDFKEEYWRLQMSNEELDNWEQKRVERLPGESDNILRKAEDH